MRIVADSCVAFDALRSVGITAKRIAAVSAGPLRGKMEVDASGLVTAPGFIDLHQHSQTAEAYEFKAMDGSTPRSQAKTDESKSRAQRHRVFEPAESASRWPWRTACKRAARRCATEPSSREQHGIGNNPAPPSEATRAVTEPGSPLAALESTQR
jgi:cytosine/adenosine deaminase-related metal-dependent hydrolase